MSKDPSFLLCIPNYIELTDIWPGEGVVVLCYICCDLAGKVKVIDKTENDNFCISIEAFGIVLAYETPITIFNFYRLVYHVKKIILNPTATLKDNFIALATLQT